MDFGSRGGGGCRVSLIHGRDRAGRRAARREFGVGRGFAEPPRRVVTCVSFYAGANGAGLGYVFAHVDTGYEKLFTLPISVMGSENHDGRGFGKTRG